jgi:hypothetical protein
MEAWGQVDEARPQGKQRVLRRHLDAAQGKKRGLCCSDHGVPAVGGRGFFAAVLRLCFIGMSLRLVRQV